METTATIVCTQSSQVLATRLAKELTLPLTPVMRKRFPDGEMYVQIEFASELPTHTHKKTILIGSTSTHDDIIELLLLIDACVENEIILVLPYMGYTRQDQRFRPGESISARAIAQALGARVSQVITVNIHKERVLSEFLVPAQNISLAAEIAAHIKAMISLDEKPLLLAPDKGALGLIQDIAMRCNYEYDYLSKRRISGEEVVIEAKSVPVAGRKLVIIDDIISTGGTLATSAKMLIAQGAPSVHAICVHGVFIQGAYARLKQCGIEYLCSSDTIESAGSGYSAAPAIAQAVREIL
ncbi:MAG: ribose-phosphate diphosphokinase [Methanomicrobiales archaeon]|nr:ribose-phosphate diphosphokinase [Methanomicrobiales archaeon]